jgi:hypothetical protein
MLGIRCGADFLDIFICTKRHLSSANPIGTLKGDNNVIPKYRAHLWRRA